MLNQIVIMGRLVRDPELRVTPSGKNVASFTVAVDRDYIPQNGEKETDFIDCVAWGKEAEFVNKYFLKGSLAAVTGRIQNRSWEDKDGNKRRTAEIMVHTVYFGSTTKKDQGSDFPVIDSEEDLPF